MEELDLHIHVGENCGKTVSKFGVGHSNEVVFINDHPSKILTVSIQTEPKDGNAICCGGKEFRTFEVGPGGEARTFSICPSFRPKSPTEKKTFKYTATLEGSEPEDPVIIIERR